MSRSSIFSSDTLRPRGLRPWGALLATGVLLAVEVGVARRDWVWDAVPASDVGIMSLLESRVIEPAVAPSVLLMGSSRIRDAVLPRRLEERLELPAGSVLNLGLTGGTPHDALVLYRRHRAKLSQAKYLVMSAEDWYLNAGIGPDERDRRYATLGERLTDYEPPYRLPLLVGWLWRTYDARDAMRRVLGCIREECPSRALLSADGRVIFRRVELETGPLDLDVSSSVAGFYEDYRPGTTRLRQLRRLVAMARADGLRVLVIQFPLRDAYIEAVARRFPAAYAHYKQALHGLEGAEVVIYEAGSGEGLSSDDFYDYGHLTLRGARLMTDRLAALLRRRTASPSRPPRSEAAGTVGSSGRVPDDHPLAGLRRERERAVEPDGVMVEVDLDHLPRLSVDDHGVAREHASPVPVHDAGLRGEREVRAHHDEREAEVEPRRDDESFHGKVLDALKETTARGNDPLSNMWCGRAGPQDGGPPGPG